ncbi:threonine ammonia-lyase, biosynthetic [Gallaecimonas sp. GXIMD4217]|uniref:threonine ammonia-lyase, biosynthetic n=1 Tax=Gallaecimonas sp. GXIMD4217 TaxID=3131927 RepID=UPI00311B100D
MWRPEQYLCEALRAPVYQVALQTPLQPMARLSARLGTQILLKREDLQPVHSFKLRGAFAKVTTVSATAVVASSAGNHAQGVALAAGRLGKQAVIVMPVTAPAIKVEAVRALGAEVVLHGLDFDAARRHALALARARGLALVEPFDDPQVIAGQGTVALELVKQDSELEAVFVPIGGGGLAAGMAVLLKQLRPGLKVFGVEAEDSASMTAALAAGGPVTLDRVGLFADGVAVKRVGDETFRLCRDHLDGIVTVSGDAVCAAIKDIFDDCRALAEPAGALALAGLKQWLSGQGQRPARVAAVLSGANMAFHGLRQVAERCDLGEGSEAMLAIRIPEQRGAFLALCRLLGERMISEFNYRRQDADRARILAGVRLTGGQQEREALLAQLTEAGLEVLDLSGDEVAKLHLKYLLGGGAAVAGPERLLSFSFPEHPRALLHFLETLGSRWDISLFHYRHDGADRGRVLAGFRIGADPDFDRHLAALGYPWRDESHNTPYRAFLRAN